MIRNLYLLVRLLLYAFSQRKGLANLNRALDVLNQRAFELLPVPLLSVLNELSLTFVEKALDGRVDLGAFLRA